MSARQSHALGLVIPTFRRPEGLERAVRSVFTQTWLAGNTLDLIIVDNDPAGSALAIARVLEAQAPAAIRMKVVHCPSPGVANARNAAMDCVTTRLVAFLDDDQTAPETWLAALMEAYARYGASVTFGPVDTALPEGVTAHRAYYEQFFARNPGLKDGLTPKFFGCGNALLDLEQLPKRRPLFDAATNQTGGEDDNLFSRAQAEGATFGWAASARVWEHVPASRARLGYTLRRALAYGQGPSRIAYERGLAGLPKLVFWIGVGLGQMVVYGIVAAAMWAAGAPNQAIWLDRAVKGLGKLTWLYRFHFYGASQVTATGTPAPTSDPAGSGHSETRAA